MQGALKRLQILMGDTIQILDHMEVDPNLDQILQHIKNGLNEENTKIAESTNNTVEEQVDKAVSMTINLEEINNLVQQLEASLLENYKHSTGNEINQYEQMSLEEQLEQTESYHNKIDYLSAAKIRENINRMNEVLLSIRS
ncbi:hypothetical protein J8TS2_33740 [Lederbergia ruris]|uniref:Uncharacterized protein n=1 Tax=Lederbergia ruris TaxID=217495 RepID=A0ABQ4KMA1_9BACI|nr:hypothetical protein [Lederbergia ruris]GIN59055.1 hypothetical protein J8TS2_33740 [Lederbergia ruris]